ncbi:MAG: hypothetical protein CSA22_03305 [Deltaproteobacteria bacterium]|nr:MAG: hypothetical protein CSA22_03305 [Deltaproteobacteria bacterium]
MDTSTDALYLVTQFIQGPLVWVAFIVFFGGLLVQSVRIFSLTRAAQLPTARMMACQPSPDLPKKNWGHRLSRSILGVSPATTLVTSVFHVCLFVTPLFLLGHNILLDNAFGIHLISFSEATSDILTRIYLLCGLYFLTRRLFLPRVRVITTVYDYAMLFLAMAPFLTGLLAYHQIFTYKPLIVLHILCGEIMLMAVPFTKFVHMMFFFIFRFFVVSEYSLGIGNRNW